MANPSGITYGVDTGLLIQMSKDYQQLLNTLKNKTANSNKLDKDPVLDAKVDATISLLEKQLKEVGELTKRAKEANELAKSTKLTDVQKKVLLEELQKDFSITLKTFEKTPKDLTDFMKEFRNIAGATDLKRTFEEISTLSKKISEIAEYNKKIESSRKKLFNDVVGDDWNSGLKGVGKSALFGALGSAVGVLGPFSAFLNPVGSFLKKEAPTIIGALKRKKQVISPTESDILRNGGNVGKAIVWQTRELSKNMQVGEEGLLNLGNSIGGLSGFFRNIKTPLWGIRNNILTKDNLGRILKTGLAGVIIGVTLSEMASGVIDTFKDLIGGTSPEDSGENTANENNPWNLLNFPHNFGAALGAAAYGAGRGFSLGWDFGKETGIPVVSAPTFGLYGAGMGAGDYFFDWFKGYSNSDAITSVPILGDVYSAWGTMLNDVWDYGRAIQSWAAGDGGAALDAWKSRREQERQQREEMKAIRLNGGVPLNSTGGLTDDTIKSLQSLWFLLQFDSDSAKRGALLKNLTSLGVSSNLIETGLTPEEQSSLVSNWGTMEDQIASLKKEYSVLLLPSSDFEKRKDEATEILGLGTESNPVIVSLDEETKQTIVDNISKNVANNFVFQPPQVGLDFDFSRMRI